jgi:hypothetical protein
MDGELHFFATSIVVGCPSVTSSSRAPDNLFPKGTDIFGGPCECQKFATLSDYNRNVLLFSTITWDFLNSTLESNRVHIFDHMGLPSLLFIQDSRRRAFGRLGL